MDLVFLSPAQAISVWADLEDAYHGTHGYGGHTAEIYAYRLGVLTTRVALGDTESSFGKPAFDLYSRQAGTALYWMLKEFQKRRKCDVKIEDDELQRVAEELQTSGFGHRIHVTITPQKEGN